MAAWLHVARDTSEISTQRTWIAGRADFLPAGCCCRQPDFGNAVLLGLIVFLLFVAGIPCSRSSRPASRARLVGSTSCGTPMPAALDRLPRSLAANPLGEGFQLVQSFVAFGRGGAFGVGLGNWHQKLAYLPEAHTDFILALIAEELGLVGVLVVLGAFAALSRGQSDRTAGRRPLHPAARVRPH